VDKTNALLTKVLDGIHRQSEQVMNGNETSRDGPGNGNSDVEFYWSLTGTGTVAKCFWASGTTWIKAPKSRDAHVLVFTHIQHLIDRLALWTVMESIR
jgi:hypothetical protein